MVTKSSSLRIRLCISLSSASWPSQLKIETKIANQTKLLNDLRMGGVE
jgi:hypothetical protein